MVLITPDSYICEYTTFFVSKNSSSNISPKQQNALPNGLICLKGGELEHETMPFKHKTVIHSLSENFEEEFFETKKEVYSQI